MNVKSAWRAGYTGRGVLVAVVDDGVNMNHPDLVSNFVSILLIIKDPNYAYTMSTERMTPIMHLYSISEFQSYLDLSDVFSFNCLSVQKLPPTKYATNALSSTKISCSTVHVLQKTFKLATSRYWLAQDGY